MIPKITYTTTDISPYIDSIPTGWITTLCNTTPPKWKPTFIRDYFQFVAVFDHNLSNVRIYREGYLDKVMISGVNNNGIRTHVFVNKYPKRKKARNRWFHTTKSKELE